MAATIRNSILVLILGLSCTSLHAQNFVGLNESSISALLKTTYPQFKQEKNVVNDAYEYLKFVDRITEQTILFFMSDEGECTYVRWISDYSNLNDMLNMLNNEYRKTGNNTWSYADKGSNYIITLEEDEWYFTVSFRKQ